jgi:hypothetical protein
MLKLYVDKPRLGQVEHYYSRVYYESRVSAEVDAAIAAEQRKPPECRKKAVSIRQAITRQCWNNESPEFRAEVKRARDAEFAQKMDNYNAVVGGMDGNSLDYVTRMRYVAIYFLFTTIIHTNILQDALKAFCRPFKALPMD